MIEMELFNEFILSLITILVALLIAKLAPAPAELGRHPADHSVELEEFGRRRREISENIDVGTSGVDKIGLVKEPKSDKFDLNMAKKRNFKKADVIMEEEEEEGGEAVQEWGSYFEIGKVDDVAVKFVEEEKRPSESYSEIGKVEDVAAKFVLEEEDKRSDVSMKGLNESVSVGQEAAELIDFDQDEGESETQLIDFCKDVDVVKVGLVNAEGIGRGEEEEGTLLYGEDEWEGIEISELEKRFGMAVGYVGSEEGGSALLKVSSDVQKQLYGLHKVATEGPCYEAQPLTLKVSATAKWHSWQRLGNMNPDVAMEQYIALLSESIPGCLKEKHRVDTKQGKCNDIPNAGASKIEVPDFSSRLHDQPNKAGSQRAFEEPSFVEAEQTSSSNLFAEGLTKTAFLFDLLSPTTTTFLTLYR